jgi:transcriptional regulator GlxA family with amidase domain
VLVSARGATRIGSTHGLEVHGVVACPDDLDVLLVPGIMHDSPADLVARVQSYEPERALLAAQQLRGVHIAGSCSGGFLLAEAGLLDGRRATVSWWLSCRRSNPRPARRRRPRPPSAANPPRASSSWSEIAVLPSAA